MNLLLIIIPLFILFCILKGIQETKINKLKTENFKVGDVIIRIKNFYSWLPEGYISKVTAVYNNIKHPMFICKNGNEIESSFYIEKHEWRLATENEINKKKLKTMEKFKSDDVVVVVSIPLGWQDKSKYVGLMEKLNSNQVIKLNSEDATNIGDNVSRTNYKTENLRLVTTEEKNAFENAGITNIKNMSIMDPDMNKLLAEACRKYPIGTVVKSFNDGHELTITGIPKVSSYGDVSCDCKDLNGRNNTFLYFNNKWIEIVTPLDEYENRWLKCIKDNNWGRRCNCKVGDYVQLGKKSGSNTYNVLSSTIEKDDTFSLNRLNEHKYFELMPVDWVPEIEESTNFKVGDWIIVINSMCCISGTTNGSIGQIQEVNPQKDFINPGYDFIYSFIQGAKCSSRKNCTRLATAEEIEKHLKLFPTAAESPAKPSSQEELLAKAMRDYPIGTKFKCPENNSIYTVKEGWRGTKGYYNGDFGDTVLCYTTRWNNQYLYYDGKWAEIIKDEVESFPKKWFIPYSVEVGKWLDKQFEQEGLYSIGVNFKYLCYPRCNDSCMFSDSKYMPAHTEITIEQFRQHYGIEIQQKKDSYTMGIDPYEDKPKQKSNQVEQAFDLPVIMKSRKHKSKLITILN